jgi:hypothetical protein
MCRIFDVLKTRFGVDIRIFRKFGKLFQAYRIARDGFPAGPQKILPNYWPRPLADQRFGYLLTGSQF